MQRIDRRAAIAAYKKRKSAAGNLRDPLRGFRRDLGRTGPRPRQGLEPHRLHLAWRRKPTSRVASGLEGARRRGVFVRGAGAAGGRAAGVRTAIAIERAHRRLAREARRGADLKRRRAKCSRARRARPTWSASVSQSRQAVNAVGDRVYKCVRFVDAMSVRPGTTGPTGTMPFGLTDLIE